MIRLDFNRSIIAQIGTLEHHDVGFIIGELRAAYSLYIGFLDAFYISDHDFRAPFWC